ncbi:MAG: anti-sigma factor [Kaiparowitsia implicata GSE-PSE-MK54-09C]|jgi:anti-sigma-K factor RskA|nr:anti-sigma factor [Kaiparowitsia implicata GSE-PSE-MK54-09C]
MALSMPSEYLQDLIVGYVLNNLNLAEAAELEQLMAEDPAIAQHITQEIAQLQRTLDTIYPNPIMPPPEHLRDRILSAHAQPATQPASTRKPTATPRHRTWQTPLGLTAAALILALGLNNIRLWRTVQTLQAQQQQFETLTYALQSIDGTQPATAIITINPNTLDASVSVANLPPLPPDQVYAIWTLPQSDFPATVDQRGAILTGTFTVDASGNIVSEDVLVPSLFRESDLVDRVTISIEDADAPQVHRGDPILIDNS